MAKSNNMRVYDNGIYRDATPEEVEQWSKNAITPQEQIADCKQKLSETDYKAIKYAEGLISEEEYAPIRAERQALRDKINELEKQLEYDNQNL